MENLEYEVMTKYPLLSASEDLTRWSGFLSTKIRAALISVVVPRFPRCDNMRLETRDLDEKSIQFWKSVMKQLPQNPRNCNFLDYLNMIETKLNAVLGGDVGDESAAEDELKGRTGSPTVSVSDVIAQVEKIGVANVKYLSPDFKELVIKHIDRSEREHQMKLTIPDKYPGAKPKVMCDLPLRSDKDYDHWPLRIQDIHNTFLTNVEMYCKFWDDMDDLDSRVKVIDPIQPSRSHRHRRILLEDNVIIHVIFNPAKPRSLPEISFSGPEKLVEAYNSALDRECKMWDETMRAVQNLRSMLDCEFAAMESESCDEDEPTPCTVCYVYSFDEEIPEINCVCGATFHKQCLQDLFISVGNHGLRRCVECPNCQMEIMVPHCLAVTSW